MAKDLKAKEPKKKGRRLKRTVRRTLGTICLISAILVASIPTEGLKRVAAEDLNEKINEDAIANYLKGSSNEIPDLKDYKGEIYNSGNGFQFAFVSPKGEAFGDDRIAVILGFSENAASQGGTLSGETLTIPVQMDAYLNYTDTDGNYSFVAVSKDNSFLFYEASPEETDASTGDVVTPAVYRPCYYNDFNTWKNFDDTELYYRSEDSSDVTQYVQVGSGNDNKMRIKNAQVRYIGNQCVETTNGESQIVDTSTAHRVFGNISNVNTLKIEADLYGIGNYAFYGSGSLREITLNSSLGYIGNYAFADCNNMTTANLDSDMRLKAIGVSAFENCQALDSFLVPHNVGIIGDRAFKGCAGDTTGLRTIDLRGGGSNPSLRQIGCDLFVNCNKLTSVTFPGSLTEDVDISNFEGCTSLQYIAVSSRNTNITQGKKDSFGYKEFQQQYNESSVIQGTFYFEGPSSELNPSVLHQTARDNYFAFSYLNESTLESMNLYELTTDAGNGIKATYRVNNQNVLVSTKLDNSIEKIILPNNIGPYYIATIDAGVFQDYCYVKQLTVPATVRQINTNAFAGCHKLEYVLFDDPTNLTIADGAFRTQNVGIHKCELNNSSQLPKEPTLTFIGPISEESAPFNYAMREANKINVGDQVPTYITYFSGWPTGLVVQHNPDTGKNELKDYPTLGDLQSPSSSYMYKTYGAIDSETAEKYRDAMANASSQNTDYEREIWQAVLNIVLPAGIDGIEAGLFKEKEVEGLESTYLPSNTYKTLTAYGLKEVAGDDDPDDDVDSGCFANCVTFNRIALYGDTVSIGDYAFKGCTNLTSVTVPNTVTTIGKIPFTGCEKLTNVDFQSSEYFECYNSIIYQLDTVGNRYKLIEYLEGRSSRSITDEDVRGLSEIAEEAFAGTSVSYVDLSTTNVGVIPERAFADCEKLTSVVLPNSVRSVENRAFTRCPNLLRIEIPNLNTVFRIEAVDTETVVGPDGKERPDALVFVCKEESMAAEYAKTYGFEIDPNGVKVYCHVKFYDWDGTLLKDDYVIQGQSATPPADPYREGYVFAGWNKDYETVREDMEITAMYDAEDPNAKIVIVTFLDDDMATVLYTREVTIGKKVDLPPEPKKDGYVFIGWIGGDLDAPITEATSFVAKWEAIDGRYVVRFIDYDGTVLNQQLVEPGEAAYEPKAPEREGYTFAGWVPADFSVITRDTDIYATYIDGNGNLSGGGLGDDGSGGNGSGGNGSGNGSGGNGSGGSGADDTEVVLYTLSVINGSGSGSYVAGSQPVIVANNPPSGQEFSHWTIEPSDTKIASTVLSATVVTMPEENVTVTAHYKTKTGSSSGSSTVSGNNSNRPNSNSGTMSTGTTVVIDKNGLSNTGVVSATVRGSSDNFTIKITESSAASEAVLKALQAEYGDISNIKYFPMDISLYDSTGTKKITDTTGLSVTITLPLPDSLITYAGNNKVAGVVNNRLDKLSTRFTTIDKVACVTFTAEHFSPYVIYVETDNLLESSVVDYTPKTGDGIHPKWFLSIGLACVAVVLFMKKDKRSLQKVKAA